MLGRTGVWRWPFVLDSARLAFFVGHRGLPAVGREGQPYPSPV